MDVFRILGWLLLKFVPHRFFTVIDVEKKSRDQMQKAVALEWPRGRFHFVYLVELYPGNKWVPEPWQEEYVLGLYRSADEIWDTVDTVSLNVSKQRKTDGDRHVIPEWVFVLVL